jgi:hypothetical protein
MVISKRAINVFLLAIAQCGPSVGVLKPIFAFCIVIVSSAHLRSGMTLTDEGLLLGNVDSVFWYTKHVHYTLVWI